ncbi:hypothetical protein FACS1894211_01650 [Clostridia bacterium]|nr:hypothetical protein FACS1894211_01650 [Clostridia bacterium]
MKKRSILSTIVLILAVLLAAFALSACGGDGPDNGNNDDGNENGGNGTGTVAELTVDAGTGTGSAVSAVLGKDDTLTLKAYADGTAVTEGVQWATSDASIVSVGAADGKATGVAKGTATVTASRAGKSATVTFEITEWDGVPLTKGAPVATYTATGATSVVQHSFRVVLYDNAVFSLDIGFYATPTGPMSGISLTGVCDGTYVLAGGKLTLTYFPLDGDSGRSNGRRVVECTANGTDGFDGFFPYLTGTQKAASAMTLYKVRGGGAYTAPAVFRASYSGTGTVQGETYAYLLHLYENGAFRLEIGAFGTTLGAAVYLAFDGTYAINESDHDIRLTYTVGTTEYIVGPADYMDLLIGSGFRPWFSETVQAKASLPGGLLRLL